MSPASPSPQFGAEDFDALESAVMETTRGRWFLAEYARRIRSAESRQIIQSLARLENLMQPGRVAPPPPPLPKVTNDAPVDALMQRLQSAIAEMSSGAVDEPEMAGDKAQPGQKSGTTPKTFAEIEAMSPADRLKLFY